MQIPEIASDFIKSGKFPIKHISYSAMKQYLTDPRQFLKKYIRHEFDDTTSPSYMAGLAVHKALEVYFSKMIESGEILPIESVYEETKSPFDEKILLTKGLKDIALEYMYRIIDEKAGKAFANELNNNGIEFEYPSFTKDEKDEEIKRLRTSAETKLREVFSQDDISTKKDDGSMDEDAIDARIIEIANSLIKWGESSLDDIKEWIVNALENYFANQPEYKTPVVTERYETVPFQNPDGVNMPIPIKVGVDRIDIDGDFCDIVDYKTVDSFTDNETDKVEYQMQSIPNYYAAYVITGKKPRRMIFEEILKKHPGYEYKKDPERKTLKADLIEIALENGIELEKGELVESMKQKLINAGVFTRKLGVNRYIINFDEVPETFSLFCSLYNGILTMVALSEMFGVYLPNIAERYSGFESTQDFKKYEC